MKVRNIRLTNMKIKTSVIYQTENNIDMNEELQMT